MDELYGSFDKSDGGWRECHKSSFTRMTNDDCHSAQGQLFEASLGHLEVCMREGDKLLKQIKFCETELKTMRERAKEMETLGLMDESSEEGAGTGAEKKGEITGETTTSYSFVEEGLKKIKTRQDQALLLLENIVDDAFKTEAILDSENMKNTSNEKLAAVLEGVSKFAEFLNERKREESTIRPFEEESSAPLAEPQEAGEAPVETVLDEEGQRSDDGDGADEANEQESSNECPQAESAEDGESECAEEEAKAEDETVADLIDVLDQNQEEYPRDEEIKLD